MQFQIISNLKVTEEETSKFYGKYLAGRSMLIILMGPREINTGSSEGIQGGIWPAPPQSPTLSNALSASTTLIHTASHDQASVVNLFAERDNPNPAVLGKLAAEAERLAVKMHIPV